MLIQNDKIMRTVKCVYIVNLFVIICAFKLLRIYLHNLHNCCHRPHMTA